MSDEANPVSLSVTVPRSKLCAALRGLDFSGNGPAGERIELFSRSGKLVIRQGYIEQTLDCSGEMDGVFSIAVSSLQKWDRAQRSGLGDETLRFANGKLNVANLSLPIKWQTTVQPLPHSSPRVIAAQQPAIALPKPPDSVSNSAARTCENFRASVKTDELLKAFRHFANEASVSDINLRTWSGNFILRSARSEVRLDVEGKIKGFSVIPSVALPQLCKLETGDERFTLLICEKRVLKLFGHRIKLPAKAIPVEITGELFGSEEESEPQLNSDITSANAFSENQSADGLPICEPLAAAAATATASQTTMSLRAILKLADSWTQQQLCKRR